MKYAQLDLRGGDTGAAAGRVFDSDDRSEATGLGDSGDVELLNARFLMGGSGMGVVITSATELSSDLGSSAQLSSGERPVAVSLYKRIGCSEMPSMPKGGVADQTMKKRS